VTEFETITNRGHALTIDHGWREVADKAFAFGQALCCARRQQGALSRPSRGRLTA